MTSMQLEAMMVREVMPSLRDAEMMPEFRTRKQLESWARSYFAERMPESVAFKKHLRQSVDMAEFYALLWREIGPFWEKHKGD